MAVVQAILALSALVLTHLQFTHGQELIANPDFEQPFDGDDWYCFGSCTLTQTDSDAYSGTYSGQVTGRYIKYTVLTIIILECCIGIGEFS